MLCIHFNLELTGYPIYVKKYNNSNNSSTQHSKEIKSHPLCAKYAIIVVYFRITFELNPIENELICPDTRTYTHSYRFMAAGKGKTKIKRFNGPSEMAIETLSGLNEKVIE